MGGWDISLAQILGLWVRRRSYPKRGGSIIKKFFSLILLPVIYILYIFDQPPKQFHEGTMINGLIAIVEK
mgnify:CR=1 FL=1